MRAALLLLLGAAVLPNCARQPQPGSPSSTAQPPSRDPASRLADSLLALMTLEEKLGQLEMAPGDANQTGPAVSAGGDQQVREGRIGSFLGFWGAAATRRMQRVAVEQSRLHIPLLFAHDVIHGWRTVFPVPLAEAASFDPAAVEGAARIAAVEATGYGVHWTFAPMVDIARDPRWGRVVEGSGEDPHLGSVMAAARVRGFQGDPSRRSGQAFAATNTLIATPKHFAAYGAAEGGRDYNTADVSERTLWEVYLPPFEAAVRAGAGSIMAAFNDIGGTPAHASQWLLTDVLRRRWGFKGMVVSDWAGVEQLGSHGIAATRAEAAARALEAGVDIEMSTDLYRTDLPAAVRAGRIPSAAIDSAVRRLLRAKYALGLFDDPYRYSDTVRERQVTLTREHRAAARALAREAIVLLKNDTLSSGSPVLPLRKDLGTIAVIGPLADDSASALGSWAGAGRKEDVITLLAGIRRAVRQGTRVVYARGAPVDTVNTTGFAEAERLARSADAVLLVLGERADMSAEAASRASLELPGAQLELLKALVRAARSSDPGKPVVAVLMNGRPLALQWLADSVPAIVETWFLGVEHGTAAADVLFGDYNPSGRLPVSFPRVTGQVPIYYSHKSTGRPPVESDHFTSKYIDVPWTPLWTFGQGLSYTTFTYANLRLSSETVPAADTVVVSVDVTNNGRRPGDEVVQVYLRDEAASVTRPVKALKGFRRITLKAGETRTVSVTLRPDDLALHDLTMRKVVEPGRFIVFVGGSSMGGLESHFEVVGDTLVLAPPPPRVR